jgi:hypothetical protein
MFRPLSVLLLAALSSAGCASGGQAPAAQAGRIAPREAIVAAADAAPRRVFGTFAMHVNATGRVGGRVFLNSEADYRDQRNLTVAIRPHTADVLTRRNGAPPERFYRGRDIEIRGAAQRTRILIIGDNGRPTGLYYYQTHVVVTDADQISVVAD